MPSRLDQGFAIQAEQLDRRRALVVLRSQPAVAQEMQVAARFIPARIDQQVFFERDGFPPRRHRPGARRTQGEMIALG
ncbi:hypothetical protein AB4084_17400, partial [Lysobacter sp. 2RAB21]